MRVVVLLAVKDLRLRLRDRSALVLAVVAPVMLAFITSSAFAAIGERLPSSEPVDLAFVDEDGGAAGAALHRALLSPPLERVVSLTGAHTAASARQLVAGGDEDAALIVPAGFSAALGTASPADIVVVKGEGQYVGNAMAEAVAEAFVARVNAAKARTASGGVEFVNLPVEVMDVDAGAEPRQLSSYFGPSMAMVFLFFSVGFAGKSLWVERRECILSRIHAAPVSPWQVLAGKAVAATALGLMSMTMMWLAGLLLFGVSWGDPLAVAGLLVAMAMAAMAVTAAIAAFASSEERVDLLTGLTSFLFAIIGGNFVQYYQLPSGLRLLSKLSPNGWAMRGFADLLAHGGGVTTVAPSLAAISVFAIVVGAAAIIRLRTAVAA